MIPAALDKGEYLLSIVTQYSGGGVHTLWALLPVRDNLRSNIKNANCANCAKGCKDAATPQNTTNMVLWNRLNPFTFAL